MFSDGTESPFLFYFLLLGVFGAVDVAADQAVSQDRFRRGRVRDREVGVSVEEKLFADRLRRREC